MNSSSARTRSSSDSGALAERVQQNWHLFFSVLMVPVVCLSVLENGLALAVLLRVRAGRGLGATSRAYYLVLAAAYIGYLLGYHVAKCFAEFGLRYPNADGNTYFLSLTIRHRILFLNTFFTFIYEYSRSIILIKIFEI